VPISIDRGVTEVSESAIRTSYGFHWQSSSGECRDRSKGQKTLPQGKKSSINLAEGRVSGGERWKLKRLPTAADAISPLFPEVDWDLCASKFPASKAITFSITGFEAGTAGNLT